VPEGPMTDQLQIAASAGALLVRHRPGHNSVIIARARADAAARGWTYVPFGMECHEAVGLTARQTANIPDQVQRIVIPVGSGMSLAGVLHGLRDPPDTTVLGVCVGADPTRRLARWAPPLYERKVKLIDAGVPYHRPAVRLTIGDVLLDPIYEAKCLPFLQAGDLLWVVGVRDNGHTRSDPTDWQRGLDDQPSLGVV